MLFRSIREIMRLAANEGKAVELNASEVHLMNDDWFKYGKEFGTIYSIGSDAHSAGKVCQIEASLSTIARHEIPDEKIIDPYNI